MNSIGAQIQNINIPEITVQMFLSNFFFFFYPDVLLNQFYFCQKEEKKKSLVRLLGCCWPVIALLSLAWRRVSFELFWGVSQ